MKPALTLIVAPGIEAQFNRLAKKTFPVEAFGYLLGTIAGGTIYLDELWIPEDLAKYATPFKVELPGEWAVDATEYAKENDMEVFGDIHSHGYTLKETAGRIQDRVQSERDIDLSVRNLVAGICNVQEMKRLGKPTLRASIRWWGPTHALDVKREKNNGDK